MVVTRAATTRSYTSRKIIKVRCGHSYDELQSIMGNAESQKGRKVSLHYTGYSDSDKSKGYAKAQIDHDAGMLIQQPSRQSNGNWVSCGNG